MNNIDNNKNNNNNDNNKAIIMVVMVMIKIVVITRIITVNQNNYSRNCINKARNLLPCQLIINNCDLHGHPKMSVKYFLCSSFLSSEEYVSTFIIV